MASPIVSPSNSASKRFRLRSSLAVLLLLVVFLMASAIHAHDGERSSDLASVVYLPVSVRALPPPPTVLANGDFEQGQVGWLEYSAAGFPIIVDVNSSPVTAASGSWLSWLAGAPNEASIISQEITLPTDGPILYYWFWIASEDVCNVEYDIAGVFFAEEVVDAYILCEENSTGGWQRRVVNLSAFAGQRGFLEFTAFTDDVLNSNLFIDEVTFNPDGLRQLPPPVHDGSVPLMVKEPQVASEAVGESRDRRRLEEFLSGWNSGPAK